MRPLTLMLLVLGLSSPTLLSAQTGSADPPARIVVVARVESLSHPGAAAVVLRRPSLQPGDVILVTGSTRPADLAKAFEVEREMRAPILPARARIRDGVNVGLSAEILRKLADAPKRPVDGVGRLPAVPVPTRVGAGGGG